MSDGSAQPRGGKRARSDRSKPCRQNTTERLDPPRKTKLRHDGRAKHPGLVEFREVGLVTCDEERALRADAIAGTGCRKRSSSLCGCWPRRPQADRLRATLGPDRARRETPVTSPSDSRWCLPWWNGRRSVNLAWSIAMGVGASASIAALCINADRRSAYRSTWGWFAFAGPFIAWTLSLSLTPGKFVDAPQFLERRVFSLERRSLEGPLVQSPEFPSYHRSRATSIAIEVPRNVRVNHDFDVRCTARRPDQYLVFSPGHYPIQLSVGSPVLAVREAPNQGMVAEESEEVAYLWLLTPTKTGSFDLLLDFSALELTPMEPEPVEEVTGFGIGQKGPPGSTERGIVSDSVTFRYAGQERRFDHQSLAGALEGAQIDLQRGWMTIPIRVLTVIGVSEATFQWLKIGGAVIAALVSGGLFTLLAKRDVEEAEEGTWEFYEDGGHQWRWRRRDAAGSIIGRASKGFLQREECVQNARLNGYRG